MAEIYFVKQVLKISCNRNNKCTASTTLLLTLTFFCTK